MTATGRTDALVGDLERRLREAGLPVVAGVAAPDRPLDLAVADAADPARMLLAVDVDGPAHAGLGSADLRERQRRAAFERSGWRYLRVAAMDLFCDPEREVERITSAWRAAGGRPAPPAQGGAPADGDVSGQPRTRTPWPDVTPGRPVSAYDERELDAVARWILSDGVVRTAEELVGRAARRPADRPAQRARGRRPRGRRAARPRAGHTGSVSEPAPEPSPSPEPAAPPPDPEDWQSTAASSDDERYLSERPPHWE